MKPAGLRLRREIRPEDRAPVHRMTAATGFFRPEEVEVAVELVDESLAKGAEGSGYHFLFADDDAGPVGYTSFGPIAGTVGRYDLYWIVVDPARQGEGIGRWLMAEAEAAIAAQGGRRVYVETSSLARYEPTRAFYAAVGYEVVAVLPDFYDAGDGKVILSKDLA